MRLSIILLNSWLLTPLLQRFPLLRDPPVSLMQKLQSSESSLNSPVYPTATPNSQSTASTATSATVPSNVSPNMIKSTPPTTAQLKRMLPSTNQKKPSTFLFVGLRKLPTGSTVSPSPVLVSDSPTSHPTSPCTEASKTPTNPTTSKNSSPPKSVTSSKNIHRLLFPSLVILTVGGSLHSQQRILSPQTSQTGDKVSLLTIGTPRLGNYEFARYLEKLLGNVRRITHSYDLITRLPGRAFGFRHPSKEMFIDIDGKQMLQCTDMNEDEDESLSCNNKYPVTKLGMTPHTSFFDHTDETSCKPVNASAPIKVGFLRFELITFRP
ncbi:hypothetical protein BC829DRAFT_420328 [Chytridium lagenaria]|nr:hypothetical protein BC829DRAFT_420328 [Chytridium lagenaria]